MLSYQTRDLIMTALGFDLKKPFTLSAFTVYMLVWHLVLPTLALAMLHGPRRLWTQLGWHANLPKGVVVGALMTLPMLLGFAFLFVLINQSAEAMWRAFYVKSFLPGLLEETIFRAFLFGQLYRYGRWPFWLATGAQGVLFGFSHLWQAHDALSAAGVFAVTFLGAIWFSWLWLSWKNLWVPITVHILMNAWWGLFIVSDSADGSWLSNGCRVATITLSVWLTVRLLHKQDRQLNIWQ